MGLGRDRNGVAVGLFGVALIVGLWVTVDGHAPPSTPLAVIAFGAAAAYGRANGSGYGPRELVAGAIAALVVGSMTRWLTPLLGVSLPDIGVFGPYTYLATEVVFGAIAVGLLVRAGRQAAERTARTVAIIYPIAYVWDWYTLEVGVFAIRLRTGVELFGIPLEEHLFMVVVPAFVLGVHEMLHRGTD